MKAIHMRGQVHSRCLPANRLYLATEGGGLEIWDVSAPADPQFLGRDTLVYAEGVAASGDCAYVTDGDSGLRVIDVSVPANPRDRPIALCTSSLTLNS
jgi:hypothetical protein